MRKLLISLVLFVVAGSIIAGSEEEKQGVLVHGITAFQGTPLSGASVRLLNTNYNTISNGDGYYVFRQVPEGIYQLEIRFLGFKPFRKEVSVNENEDLRMDIQLEIDEYQLMQTQVITQKDHLFKNIPGSVNITPKEELDRLQAVSANEVLRRTSGLNVVDEEGAGLRLNVGVRGLDPDRSRKVLIMEDGVPVALNPYGEPEMYYSPSIDRMEAVEIIKGSGQILYGPQSVGGVINFITADPPTEEEVKLKVQAGQGGFHSVLAQYGNTYNNTGVQVNYLRKGANELGRTQFQLNDLNAKIRIPINRKSVLGLKFSVYDEQSNSTYLGMTQRMYEMGENDFEVITPFDNLDVRRLAASANHRYNLNKNLIIHSTLFANTTTRNWRRQDFAFNEGQFYNNGSVLPSNYTGTMYGDSTVAGGAIFMRNRTGNRNRTFEVIGFEQKMQLKNNISKDVKNDLQVGYRYLFERAYEQRINGQAAEAISGDLINDEIRTGNAFSTYALNRIRFYDRFELSPGIRLENYQFEREIFRAGGVDTNYSARNEGVFTVIPGIGAGVTVNKNLNLYGGVHRGFSPPRVKDAIDFAVVNPVLEIDAEKSWNYEIGVRTKIYRGIRAEATLFVLDFENQVVAQSESGGAVFGVVNAGATLNRGIEGTLEINSRELLGGSWLVLFDAQATVLRATYNEDREVGGVNIRGNRLPYAPDLTVSSGLAIEAPFGTGLRLTYTHVGEQFTDELNRVLPTNNGRFGKMDAFNLFDFTAYHSVREWKTRFNVSIKNITNERYIATRRPQGISLGLPRFITFGAEIQL
ncbi:MAG: TonB-dependent receptor [Cryomorphaceae bacterium]|nr:TonB-dependent receptor [Cryomorphaceae bacterium]